MPWGNGVNGNGTRSVDLMRDKMGSDSIKALGRVGAVDAVQESAEATEQVRDYLGSFSMVGSAIWIATRSRTGVTGFRKWSIAWSFGI